MIRDVVLALILIFFGLWGPALGGMVYALVTMAQRLPIAGALFRFLISGPVPLVVPIRVLGWAISGAGLLIGLGIFALIFGPPAGRVEFWLILGISVATILRHLENSTFFTTYQHVDIRGVARLFSFERELVEFVSRNRPRLALMQYIDVNVAIFLSLFVAYGLVLYAIGHLGLMPSSGVAPGIEDALWSSLSLLSIGGGREAPFSGTGWEVMNGIATFVVWLYVILFTSFGTRILDEMLADQAKQDADLAAMMKGIEETIATAPEVSPAAPGAKPSDAAVPRAPDAAPATRSRAGAVKPKAKRAPPAT